MNSKNTTNNTPLNLLPEDRKYLMDDEAKVGQITFTTAEKKALLEVIHTKGWEIIKGVYVKQRLVQIAVAGINVSQTAEDLMFYKGKSAEADFLIKHIESAAKSLEKEEAATKANPSTF